MVKTAVTRTLSVTSGKGGVGKTTILCNLAYALAQRGKKVLLFDGDLGLANVEIFFGTKPNGTILDVMQGEKSLREVMTPVLPGLDLISGGSGLTEFNRMSVFERRALVDAVSAFEFQYDYLLIDTAPGISDQVLFLNAAVQDIVVVITPDAASLTDSYALIKVLHQSFKENRFAIICNQVRDESEGFSLFQRFAEISHRFLHLKLDYWGSLATDSQFRKCAASQRLVLRQNPSEQIRQSFDQICERLAVTTIPQVGKGGLQFFWEQVVGVA